MKTLTYEIRGRRMQYAVDDERVLLKLDKAQAGAYVMICGVNDLASFAVADAVEQLKKAGMWKREIKQYGTKALAAIQDYEHRLASTLGKEKMQTWMDIQDAIHDELEKHLSMLRMAHMQVITRAEAKNTQLMSYVTAAMQMLCYCNLYFDDYCDAMKRQLGADIFRLTFRVAKLDTAKYYWRRLLDELPGSKKPIDIGSDKDCNLALEIIDQRMSNIDWYDKVAGDVLSKMES